jgi:hypothetical protein
MLNHRCLSKRSTPCHCSQRFARSSGLLAESKQMPKAARYEIGSTAFLPGRSIA